MKIYFKFVVAKILTKIRPVQKPINPTWIDLTTTTRPKSFQQSEVIETVLSDFYKISLMIMKVFYNKQKVKTIQFRKDKDFSNGPFKHEFEKALSSISHISSGTFKSTVVHTSKTCSYKKELCVHFLMYASKNSFPSTC